MTSIGDDGLVTRCKGAYAGREVEWARQEADIIAASREGRVSGIWLTK